MTDATATADPPSVAASAVPPSPPQQAAPPAPQQTLDELMMAMDVVDTLRHQDKLVQDELGQTVRDEDLKRRLRELYESQGLTVTESILDQGIRALKESRFTYQSPSPSWSLWFAKLWVRRTSVAMWPATALAALGIGWGGYYFGFVSPQRAEAERTRTEISLTLPRDLEDTYVGVVNLADSDEARRQAGALRAEGMWALGRKDVEGVRKAQAQLSALGDVLRQEYKIQIINKGPAGIERIPDENERARNYYLIVQAIAQDGAALPVRIASEEDGVVRQVVKWGVRVSEKEYRAVQRDRNDNGIIEKNVLGQKRRGQLESEYDETRVQRGFITEW